MISQTGPKLLILHMKTKTEKSESVDYIVKLTRKNSYWFVKYFYMKRKYDAGNFFDYLVNVP